MILECRRISIKQRAMRVQKIIFLLAAKIINAFENAIIPRGHLYYTRGLSILYQGPSIFTTHVMWCSSEIKFFDKILEMR